MDTNTEASALSEAEESSNLGEEINCIFSFSLASFGNGGALRSLVHSLATTFLENLDLDQKPVLKHRITNQPSNTGLDLGLEIFMKAGGNEVIAFSELLATHLPISFHLIFTGLRPLDKDELESLDIEEWESYGAKRGGLENDDSLEVRGHAGQSQESKSIQAIPENQEQNSQAIPPTAMQLANLLNETSPDFYNLNGLITILDSKNTESSRELIEGLAGKLAQGGRLGLRRGGLGFSLSTAPIESKRTQLILFADLSNALSYLRLGAQQKEALASLEKPKILCQCKQVFAKQLNANSGHKVFASLPSDPFLLLLLDAIKNKHGLDYVFLDEEGGGDPQLSYDEVRGVERGGYYTVANELAYCAISHAEARLDLKDFLKIYKSSGKRLIVQLSSNSDTAFWIEGLGDGFHEILKISLDENLAIHLVRLAAYENGAKLLKNFANAFPEVASKWGMDLSLLSYEGTTEILESTPQTANLLHILKLIKNLLGLDEDVLDYASKCVRDRGPRIDYKLVRVGEDIALDYPRLFRSALSFHLAGVESELLCYGVLESLAEFVGTLAGDLLVNYGVDEVFACGDLLLEQCFLDKLITSIPKNIRLSLPRIYGLKHN